MSLNDDLDGIFSFEIPVSASSIEKSKSLSNAVAVVETELKTVEIRTLEDKEFIRDNLKEMIDIAKSVLVTVKDDIKIGAPATRIEAFSLVLKELTVTLEKLTTLNKTVLDIELQQVPPIPVAPVVNNNLIMDSKAMLALIRKGSKLAKEDSELNTISTEFEDVK